LFELLDPTLDPLPLDPLPLLLVWTARFPWFGVVDW
jgi:hypothetical protein